MAHEAQSRPDSGLGFQVKALATFHVVPPSLRSGPTFHVVPPSRRVPRVACAITISVLRKHERSACRVSVWGGFVGPLPSKEGTT